MVSFVAFSYEMVYMGGYFRSAVIFGKNVTDGDLHGKNKLKIPN